MFGLGRPSLTAAFWGAIVVIAATLLWCPYPPMIDYPQHVAMGAVLHDLFVPGTQAHALYQTNLFTYNGGIELAIALLSFLMSAERAGQLLLATYVLTFAWAAIALLDFAKRPRWYALLFVPIVYSHVVGWGFANFVLATPFIILVSVWWLRLMRGERRRSLVAGALLGSLFVAYTHVLAMLMICVVVAVMSLDLLFGLANAQSPWRLRVKALLVPAAVLVPAVGYSLAAWFWARATSTTVWEHSWAEGQDDPAWQKLWSIAYNATGNFTNNVDQHLVLASVGIGLLVWWIGRRQSAQRELRMLAVVFLGLYVFIPKVFIATFHIYVRFLTPAIMFGVASLPALSFHKSQTKAPAEQTNQTANIHKSLVALLSLVASIVAVATASEVAVQAWSVPGVRDALAVIDAAPPGRRLVGVMLSIKPRTLHREIWVHLPALYQTRHHGVIAYSFMRNESVPVHYLPGKQPPRPPGGFEWNGNLYDVHAPYARAYDLVLVHTAGEQSDPAPRVFGHWETAAKLLRHQGRYFLYDISELNRRRLGAK